MRIELQILNDLVKRGLLSNLQESQERMSITSNVGTGRLDQKTANKKLQEVDAMQAQRAADNRT